MTPFEFVSSLVIYTGGLLVVIYSENQATRAFGAATLVLAIIYAAEHGWKML